MPVNDLTGNYPVSFLGTHSQPVHHRTSLAVAHAAYTHDLQNPVQERTFPDKAGLHHQQDTDVQQSDQSLPITSATRSLDKMISYF